MAIAAMICFAALSARTPDDAWSLYSDGELEQAFSIADSIAKAQPKNHDMLYLCGIYQQNAGNAERAADYFAKAKAKGSSNAAASLAEMALLDYRPDDAMSLVDDYKTLLSKTKGAKENPLADQVERQARLMLTMLERVEDIVVIDSVNVDAQTFFEAYKLTPESGRIAPTASLPFEAEYNLSTSFVSEDGHTILYPEYNPDGDGSTCLLATHWLNDGSWSEPEQLLEGLAEGSSSDYPFLMPDGQTLYFAAYGDDAVGGYDIFITRDNGDGFLPPQNIGMPYNSPYNDYMLAIDETTGIGWWATDRNQIEGMVTIYMFIPSELRKNIDIDSPDLMSRARIASIADTQAGGDYSEYMRRISDIKPAAAPEEKQFEFTAPDGSVLTDFDQLPPAARDPMAEYLNAQADFRDLEDHLAQLRESYARGDDSVGGEIVQLERSLESERKKLVELSNSVVRCL